MKTGFLIVAAILTHFACTGCVFMNDEDKEFYGKGWVHPTELDRTEPRHDPLASDPRVAGPANGASASQPAPEWIVPETSDNSQ